MDEVKKRESSYESSFYNKAKHIKEIDTFISQMKQWNVSLHLNADLDDVPADDSLSHESIDMIDYERLTELDSDRMYRVPLGKSGTTIVSPYGFIQEITIMREESYDDIG